MLFSLPDAYDAPTHPGHRIRGSAEPSQRPGGTTLTWIAVTSVDPVVAGSGPPARPPGSAAGWPRPGRTRPPPARPGAATGDGRGTASWGPTMSSQSANSERVVRRRGGPPAAARADRGCRASGAGSRLRVTGERLPRHVGDCRADRVRSVVRGALIRAGGRRPRPAAPVRARPLGGMSPAVVSTVWARSQRLEQGLAAPGVELGEHVVEQQHRRLPASAATTLVGGQPQGQGQRPLLALGGVGPGRQAVDGQVEVVAVGTRPG